MNDIQTIQNKIYEIRGQRVMLDRDLAYLYGVETKALNQAVKRNLQRFPEDFMFQLTKEECLRSQIVTIKTARGQHLKYMPYAFTELEEASALVLVSENLQIKETTKSESMDAHADGVGFYSLKVGAGCIKYTY